MKSNRAINKLNSIILAKEENNNLKPFTINEFINRIEKSEQDFQNGNFKTQEDLEKDSANW